MVRFEKLRPASPRASAAARGASAKRDTAPERVLRRALTRRGLRYRVDVASITGRPDIVFVGARVLVFCDGDFWHGRDLQRRLAKLAVGHNAPYWLEKIRRNVERDNATTFGLTHDGWTVLRFWETDILKNADAIANHVERVVRERAERPKRRSR
jgi:DNA mismatch endonuclease (patch repair protein)